MFRSCIIAVAHLANQSRRNMIFLSPLWFGVGEYLAHSPNLVLSCVPCAQRTSTMVGKHSTTSAELDQPSIKPLLNRVGLLTLHTDAVIHSCSYGLVFQLVYTTLFGWFAAYLFLRTSSIYTTCFSHIFCNFMGLPNVSGDIEQHPRHTLSELISP